jgi:hypothetical protein
MEEQVEMIGEFITGFQSQIEDLNLRSMPRSPTEVCEGRKRTKTTTVSNIKKIEGEFMKLCEENTHVRKYLIEYTEMKLIEANLREVK